MGGARLHRLGWLALLVLVLATCTQTSRTVRGVVLGVEGSLTEVTAFTLLVDGDGVRFVPAASTIDGIRYVVSVADG